MRKLLTEALDWLEEDAARIYHDNLFEKIARSAAGDERPVPEKPLDTLMDLMNRIRTRLDQEDD